MSIATEITRLQNIKTDIRSALVEKGVSASTHNMAQFAEDILSIQTDVPDLNGAIIQVSSDVGATIVAQKGGTSFTAVVTETGIVEFTVRNSGTWTVTASKDGEETISKKVNVIEDGATYEVSMFWKIILYSVGDKPSNIEYKEFKAAGSTITNAENKWLSDGATLQCGITNDNRRALNYLTNINPITIQDSVSINLIGKSSNDSLDSFFLVASDSPIQLEMGSYPYWTVTNTNKVVSYKRVTETTTGIWKIDTSTLKGMSGYVAIMVGAYNKTEAIKFRDWVVE